MALLDELRNLINLSHALAWDGAVRSPSKYNTPDEPGLVSAFLDSIIRDELEKQLRHELGSTAKIQVDSIFTHKTPLVTPTGKSPVEIGDLLLVRQHFVTGTNKAHGMALLLQAKKNTEPSSGNVSSGKPRIQFELYRDWPSFRGHGRLKCLPGSQQTPPPLWDFKISNPHGRFGEYVAIFGDQAYGFSAPLTITSASQVFLASDYPPQGLGVGPKTTWSSGPIDTTASPAGVVCPIDFARTLTDFFHGDAGEPFTPGDLSGSDHWSIFVNTMLSEAAQLDYTFLSRRTNVTSATPRGSQISTLMALQPLIKLAVMREVRAYIPTRDAYGLFDFEYEPHFYIRAAEKLDFIADLRMIYANLRSATRAGDYPPAHPEEPKPRHLGEGYHVPILSIATSGPEPLWEHRIDRRE